MPSFTFAQDIEPITSNDLITVCKEDKLNKVCETKKNGKLLRKIYYKNGKLESANIYYASERTAKTVLFDDKGQLSNVNIYPDQAISNPNHDFYQRYYFSFKSGKFLEMSDMAFSYFWIHKACKEENPNATKCDELNYFYPSSEPNLHPALALPKENQGLDVLTSNGIKMP